MQQYQRIKQKYPDSILLFRMGDFYETFNEDATTTAKVLGITLTRRGDGAARDVPLAGFPHHALDTYLPKLLKAGYRVAVCEQLENPKFATGIVKRDVIEVVTPGVAFSDKVLEQKTNNYLAALHFSTPLPSTEAVVGFSFVDASTGEYFVREFSVDQLSEQIFSVKPSEILTEKGNLQTLQTILKDRFDGIYTTRDEWVFSHEYAYELLINHFKTQSLKGIGIEDLRYGTVAAGVVLNYLQETQKANIAHIKRIIPEEVSDFMVLPSSTLRNLEVTAALGEAGHQGSLLSVLDRTRTPMGGRLLKRWVVRPLKSPQPIVERLEVVSALVKNKEVRRKLVDELTGIGDLERLIARISTGRAAPREVVGLKTILEKLPEIKASLDRTDAPPLHGLSSSLRLLQNIVELIDRAIEDNPPASVSDGGVIRKGFSGELDDLRTVAHSGKSWIANLQTKERDRTGIPSLKVGFNNVFGYYIEVTHTHREKVPPDYERKQTLTNAERYVTPELKQYEEKVLNAEEKILALETDLFNNVCEAVALETEAIQVNASALAAIDTFTSLADVASEYDYSRPEINESTRIEIEAGRHPVIERLLPPGESYIPNDTVLDNEDFQIVVLTGPNMSGKSSYLRQVGLIVLLAQMGSFVPAKAARIGIVDKLYTRVGAMDSIATGESTFLVEMNEAANIVNTATSRSLILLDEVGRGTSTFDGISIAWALTEYLHERVGAKTLFATHYHELNELAELYPRVKNYKVDVREYRDKVIFLHKVTPGFADHSYGIQVAQMAGLPEEVTDRAKQILQNLESSDLTFHADETAVAESKTKGRKSKKARIRGDVQLTLFEMRDDKLREEIKELDLEKMTPLEALQKLTELKNKTLE
ncbi:MAG TPA: DNA mismatch repair protein MutS [Bacteroidota bacterium]